MAVHVAMLLDQASICISASVLLFANYSRGVRTTRSPCDARRQFRPCNSAPSTPRKPNIITAVQSLTKHKYSTSVVAVTNMASTTSLHTPTYFLERKQAMMRLTARYIKTKVLSVRSPQPRAKRDTYVPMRVKHAIDRKQRVVMEVGKGESIKERENQCDISNRWKGKRKNSKSMHI